MEESDSENRLVNRGDTDTERGDFTDVLNQTLVHTTSHDDSWDWATFAASHLGFCPRQTYLIHLGLRETASWHGRFQARRLIQESIESALDKQYSHVEVTPSVTIDCERVHIIGRPTAYDPQLDVIYHVKPRNGWYKFHPPINRHINQLQLYLSGLDAEQGQLVYVSMSDLSEIRVWPGDYCDDTYVASNPDSTTRLVEKATRIHDEIIRNGIATSTAEIPFERCGCFLCETEELTLPTDSEATIDTSRTVSSTTPRSQTSQNVTETTGIDVEPLGVETAGTVELGSSTEHVPNPLRNERVWVIWDGTQKIPRAPWETGTMYPCEWAESKNIDPRRKFTKAQIVADLPVEHVHEAWPFPDEADLPATLKPAVLLPHDLSSSPLTFIDFDDVRNPETDAVTVEVADLLDSLGGYAEVSQSGTGIHCWVRGGLPDGYTTFSAPLDQTGHVEIYDHSRFTGNTWAHVNGTPRDAIPAKPTILKRFVGTYNPKGEY